MIVAAHRQIEAELGVMIAPVGVAMANALTERPELAMVRGARGLETDAGTYLAAATIYATVFGHSREELAYRMAAVAEEDAAFRQRIAWETVQEWQAASAPAE